MALDNCCCRTLSKITLLSSSARRREIVRSSFFDAAIEDSRGEEPRPAPTEAAEDYVVRSAVAKLGGPPRTGEEGLQISADTVVVLRGEILGKPSSKEEARSMLNRLSDAWHEVTTGVAVHRHPNRGSVHLLRNILCADTSLCRLRSRGVRLQP